MNARPLRADLHVHSNASDGTLRPRAIVRLAARTGLTHLSITDHDSVSGLDEALEASVDLGVALIPGVELSATTERGSDVHILGYFIDPTSPRLLERLARFRHARSRRAERMVRSLADAGIPVTLKEVLRFSQGGAIGRAHIARAIVASGHAVSIRDAFERLIGRDAPHYVAKESPKPEEAISFIIEAGGIPVIAHPGVGDHSYLIERLTRQGLAGIEAFHADHTPDQRAHYAALARELGLLITGGSDFHGPQGPNPPLGSVELPAPHIEALLGARP